MLLGTTGLPSATVTITFTKDSPTFGRRKGEKGNYACHTAPYMSNLKAKIKGPVFRKLSVMNLSISL